MSETALAVCFAVFSPKLNWSIFCYTGLRGTAGVRLVKPFPCPSTVGLGWRRVSLVGWRRVSLVSMGAALRTLGLTRGLDSDTGMMTKVLEVS